MKTYEIYKIEATTTKSGKNVKRLLLQASDEQYPKKNVALWEDHPEYNSVVPGGQITCELIESDSGVPNPLAPGKNYINRSIANPNRGSQPTQQRSQQAGSVSEMAIKTHISQEIAPVKEALREIVRHFNIEPEKAKIPGTDIPYPETPHSKESDYPSDEVDPEDIPF